MKGTGKIVVALIAVFLLMFTVACAPTVTEEEEVATEEEAVTEEEVAPTPVLKWGIIEIRVTDPPPADVKSAVVHLTNIEVHRVSGNESGWISIIGAPPSFDLMAVIGVEEVLGSANITAGSFTQIRMDVESVEVITVDGENFTAEVPGEKLKIVRPFEVGGGMTTALTIDFDGEKSLIVTGKGKARFKPVVKLLIEEKGKEGKEREQEEEQEREKEKEREQEEEETEELSFEGTIDIIEGNIWTITVEDETRTVDVSEAEIEGEPAVGLQAEVEGIVVDGTVLASKVKIEEV